jgi:putative adhesin
MITRFLKYLVFFLLLAGIITNARAQEANQTVTKAFTQNVNCTAGTLFTITAEKATLTITGWANNYIQARISFFASHPDKKIAQQELDYMQYAISKEKDLVELINIFKLPANVEYIKSKLEVRMELMVPSKNKIQVTNKYGEVNISRLSGNIQVNIAFGNLYFTDVTGNVVMNANYSDVRGSQINAPSLNCTDERSKIALDLESGSYSFQSKHSDIDLGIKRISALNIKANRTDITIRPQHIDDCRYKITSTDGMLYLPAKYTSQSIKKGNQTSFAITGVNTMPLLAISANFNSVTLK